MSKRTVRHDNGVHVYEGHVAIVEQGKVVYKHDVKFEPGDVVMMLYDEPTGRIAYTYNGHVIRITPPPDLAYVEVTIRPADDLGDETPVDEIDWQTTLDID